MLAQGFMRGVRAGPAARPRLRRQPDVSGLQHSRNIRIAGHFSVHGMPRSALPCTCRLTRCRRLRSTSVPSRYISGGTGFVLGIRPSPNQSPQLGTRDFRRNRVGPSARGVWGMRRGQRPADRTENQRQPQGNKATALVRCRSGFRRVRQMKQAACPHCNTLLLHSITGERPVAISPAARRSSRDIFLTEISALCFSCRCPPRQRKTGRRSHNRGILAAGATLT